MAISEPRPDQQHDRMELQVRLSSLPDRFPALHLALDDADLQWKAGMALRGLRVLPVAW